MKFRYAFDGLEEKVSSETALICDPDSEVQQSGKEDADINVIVKRFGLGFDMPAPRRLAEYGDFSGYSDFHESMNLIRDAEAMFGELPASLRSRFDNDPGKLFEFVHRPENLDEARKLGLVEPERPVAPPQKVEVVNPSPEVLSRAVEDLARNKAPSRGRGKSAEADD